MNQKEVEEGKIYVLPNELMGKIFRDLEIKEKVNFGETCKWMYSNFIKNLREENITVEMSFIRAWYIGEGSNTLTDNENMITIKRNNEIIEEYLNSEIGRNFDRLLKSKIEYDYDTRLNYRNDDYSEFERKYKWRKINYRHDYVLEAKFEKIFF